MSWFGGRRGENRSHTNSLHGLGSDQIYTPELADVSQSPTVGHTWWSSRSGGAAESAALALLFPLIPGVLLFSTLLVASMWASNHSDHFEIEIGRLPPRRVRIWEASAMLSRLSAMLASENRPLQFTDS